MTDSFLYGYDEVPFDEIPPEPGREIRKEYSGGITIKVKQDSNHIDEESTDDEISFSLPSDNKLKMTIKNDKVENIKLQVTNAPPSTVSRSKSMRRSVSERLGPPVKRTKTLRGETRSSALRANAAAGSVISSSRLGPPPLKTPVSKSNAPVCQNRPNPPAMTSTSRQRSNNVLKAAVPKNNPISQNMLPARPPLDKSKMNYRQHLPTKTSVNQSKFVPPSNVQPSRNNIVRQRGPKTNYVVKNSVVPKVKANNPIGKAKCRTTAAKTNLSKNISKGSTKAEASGKPSGMIANLIQNILDEPDIKQIISTLAEQTVSTDLTTVDVQRGFDPAPGPSNSSSVAAPFIQQTQFHTQPFTGSSSLQQNAQRILNKANNVLSGVAATLQHGSKPFAKREIPKVKTIQAGCMKFSNYCKTCKQVFPTPIVRDMHRTSELHLFASQEWWKTNPPHPKNVPRSKFPVKIFCIGCWDRITMDTQDQLSKHMDCKRHKKNQAKFAQTFGKPPLHDWCYWNTLSDNFRNIFVPPPPKMRAVLQPEYLYEQRYVLK